VNSVGKNTVIPGGDIRFFDRNLNLVCIVPRYISVDWQLNHRTWGTAEFHLPKNAETVRVLTEHSRLFLSQGSLQAVVTGYRIEKDCTVFARTCDWLLSKFTVTSYKSTKNVASEIACDMVKECLPPIRLEMDGADADHTDKTDFTIEKTTDLYSALLCCLSSEKTGISFGFDGQNKSFHFDVYQGADRSDAVLSEKMKSLYDSAYTKNLLSHTEGGVYYHKVKNCGKWDPIENTPKLANTSRHYGTYYTVSADSDSNALGLRVEKGDIVLCKEKDGTFCVVDSAEPFPVTIPAVSADIFAWSVLLSAENEEEAEQELKERKEQTTADGRNRNMILGKDFALGYTVTAEFSAEGFTFSEKRRVSSVHLWENAQGSGCLPETVSVDETDFYRE